MKIQDLALYRSFLQCARMEANLVHDRSIHRDNDEQHPLLKEIYSRLEKVKNLLTVKAYREYFIIHEYSEQPFIKKSGSQVR